MEQKVILLVEDNLDDEALTLRALKKSQIKSDVVVVRDGAEALDFLFGRGVYVGRDLKVMPTVTFMDIKLPKVDGLEVLRQMRSHQSTKTLPVVILTSSKEYEDVTAGYNSGANSYIRKPVDFAQFAQTIAQLGLYWLVLNEQPAPAW